MCKFERVQLQMPKPFSVWKNTARDPYHSVKRTKTSGAFPSEPQAVSASTSQVEVSQEASASSAPGQDTVSPQDITMAEIADSVSVIPTSLGSDGLHPTSQEPPRSAELPTPAPDPPAGGV